MAKSKKYIGKLCVYCRKNTSTTADHVFPRELFQIDERSMLPKVPSCSECNNEKSKLEHYLLSVLPFAGTHSNAHKTLSVDASKRLKKNRKLHKKIQEESGYKNIRNNNGINEERLTVPLDPEKLHTFVEFVAKGLMWHHWGEYLPLDCILKAFTPSPAGIKYIDGLFELSTKNKVNCRLAGDTVHYKGAMGETETGVTVWAIKLYGGMTVSDEDIDYVFSNSFVSVVSGSHKSISNLKFE